MFLLCFQDVVLPAEGVNDQEVADHAGNSDGEDDGADGVVRVVGHVHRGEGVWGPGRHRHLKDKQEMAHIHDNAAGCPSGTHSR